MCCVCVLVPGVGSRKGPFVVQRRCRRTSRTPSHASIVRFSSPAPSASVRQPITQANSTPQSSVGRHESLERRSIDSHDPLTDLSVLAFILFTVFPDRLGRSSLFLNSFRFHPVSTGARLPFPFFPFRVTSVPLHPLFLSPSFHHFSLIQKKAAAITTATMVFVCLSTPPCPSSHTLLWTTSSKALFFPPVSLSLFVAPPTPRQKKKNRTNDKKEAPAALHINRWTNGSRRSNPIFRLFNLPVRPVIPQLNWPDHQQ